MTLGGRRAPGGEPAGRGLAARKPTGAQRLWLCRRGGRSLPVCPGLTWVRAHAAGCRYVKKIDDIIKQYPTTKRVRLDVDLQGEARDRRLGAICAAPRPQLLLQAAAAVVWLLSTAVSLPDGARRCHTAAPHAIMQAGCRRHGLVHVAVWLHTNVSAAKRAADLSDYNAELHRRVLTSPATCLPPFEEALEEFIRNRSPKASVALLSQPGLNSSRKQRV